MTTNRKSPALVETLSHLLAMQPFFAFLLVSKMKVIEATSFATSDGSTEPVKTAATDGVNIYLNPEWFDTMTLPERVFVLLHEVSHYIHQHMPRIKMYEGMGFGPDMQPFSGEKYNHAADYVINAHLVTHKLGKMPFTGLHNPNISGEDLVDDVYCRIPDPPSQKQQGRLGQGGAGKGQGFDQHLPPPGNAPSESEVSAALVEAANVAKAMGKMPGGFERVISEILHPTKSWQEELRALMTATAGREESSWSRPHRRRLAIAPHIVMPGYTGYAMGGIVVQIDTSGSISPKELQVFMSELSGIIADCNPQWIKVLWTDSEVAGVDEPSLAADLTQLKPKGGGGTNMHAGIDWIMEEGLEPELLVTFTDGYTPWGDDPGFPCYWAITSPEITAPYGHTIHVEIPR